MVLGQRRYARGNDRRLGGGLILTCCVAGLCWIPWAAAEAGDDRPFRIGGLLFGDFYDVASHHTEEGDGATGLVSRRGYLTFDADRSTKCFGRLRFEVNQAGDNISYLPFDPSARATFFVGGVGFRLTPHLVMKPNTVITYYDRKDEGIRPEIDFHLRLTFFLDFE